MTPLDAYLRGQAAERAQELCDEAADLEQQARALRARAAILARTWDLPAASVDSNPSDL